MTRKTVKTARQIELESSLALTNNTSLTDEYILFTLRSDLGGLPIPEQLARTDISESHRAVFTDFATRFDNVFENMGECAALESAR